MTIRRYSLDRITKLRAKGWSYAKIAAKLGCSASTVMNYLKPEKYEAEQARATVRRKRKLSEWVE